MPQPSDPEIEVFNIALELPVEQRPAYLDQACAGDPTLRQHVEELLQASDAAGVFLQKPAAPPPAADLTVPVPSLPAEKTGDWIGRYKLLQQIGEGGCGVVYMAEQEQPVRRRVALKVIKLGMDTKSVIARFEAERQALALMDHPNIAKVLDAGATEMGRPYFVMELVRGIKITDYCDQNNLSTRERLDLFIEVCHAIQHAHQKGIIHRDIKPSNILVALSDGVAMPKVIDFGIAKATHGKLTDQTLFTAFEQFIGTPAYMSPEQAEMSALDIDTRSDIYSLGVLLYELLTGQTPFSAEKLLKAGLDEIRRTIREEEPARPSTRLSTMLAGELTTTAQRRQTDPPKLIHLVRGDLDWIVMKALEKARTRRYETANDLALDLQRHLNNEPVTAYPPGNFYRFQKMVRRNQFIFAAASILIFTVILALAGIFWQWRQAEFNSQDATKQRRLAEQDATETRLNLYAADISVASQALQNGDLSLARTTLDGLRPRNGDSDLRGFEWRYLWNLCRGEQLATFTGHARSVTCTAFSPGGNYIATGSLDGTVRIWGAIKRENIKTLTITSNAVWSVAFTPDGRWLMIGSSDRVEFWDIDTWQLHANYSGQLGVLSKTGTFLITADSSPFYDESTGRVALWNWQTGQLLRYFDRPGRSLAISSDARQFAMVDSNWHVTVWEAATGKLLHEWPMSHPVWSLDFSPDGRKLLVAGWSRDVSIWSLDDPSPVQTIKSQRLTFWSAAYSGDGRLIVTTGTDRRVRLWDAKTLEPKSVLRGHESEIWCAAFSPDGNYLATGGTDNAVLLWSTTAAVSTDKLPHDGDHRPSFSPDGKWLVTVNPATQDCMLWNAWTRVLANPQVAGGRFVCGYSRDGKCMATLDADRWTLQFWQPTGISPEKEIMLQGRTAGPMQFDFMTMSPSQEFIFAIGKDGLIRIWDTGTGSLWRSIKGPLPPIRNATMSPDGKYLALSLSRENIVRLYDCITGSERQLAGHLDFVSGLSFSPDGLTLATGSMDGSIRLWKTATGENLASVPAHMGETADVAFSPDGRTLASLGEGESLKLWHVPTLRQLVFEDEPQAYISLQFSPDGRNLAVEAASDKLRLLTAPPE